MRVLSPEKAREAGSQVYHEVWKDGVFTNRQFNSLVAATRYAGQIGGEVRQKK